MKNYEITYLISPDLSEEEIKSLQEKIISFIKGEGGIFNTAASVRKKTLFSPVKKKTFSYLGTLSFQFSPEKLENFEKKLKSENQILRYMVLTETKTKPPFTFRKKVIEGKLTTSRKKVVGEKVELKEIEKKLEEILGE